MGLVGNLKDHVSNLYNLVIVRNLATYELRRRQQPYQDPAPKDENGIRFRAFIDDEGGIAPINFIYFKGKSRKQDNPPVNSMPWKTRSQKAQS